MFPFTMILCWTKNAFFYYCSNSNISLKNEQALFKLSNINFGIFKNGIFDLCCSKNNIALDKKSFLFLYLDNNKVKLDEIKSDSFLTLFNYVQLLEADWNSQAERIIKCVCPREKDTCSIL